MHWCLNSPERKNKKKKISYLFQIPMFTQKKKIKNKYTYNNERMKNIGEWMDDRVYLGTIKKIIEKTPPSPSPFYQLFPYIVEN